MVHIQLVPFYLLFLVPLKSRLFNIIQYFEVGGEVFNFNLLSLVLESGECGIAGHPRQNKRLVTFGLGGKRSESTFRPLYLMFLQR